VRLGRELKLGHFTNHGPLVLPDLTVGRRDELALTEGNEGVIRDEGTVPRILHQVCRELD